VGAAVLALATVTAIVFGVINFQQRSLFTAPDDGASWLNTPDGVLAWHIVPNSPAAIAGIRTGDQVRPAHRRDPREGERVGRDPWGAEGPGP